MLTRLRINLNHNWDYFPNDKYTGIPVDGYTAFIEKLVDIGLGTKNEIQSALNDEYDYEFIKHIKNIVDIFLLHLILRLHHI